MTYFSNGVGLVVDNGYSAKVDDYYKDSEGGPSDARVNQFRILTRAAPDWEWLTAFVGLPSESLLITCLLNKEIMRSFESSNPNHATYRSISS